MHNKYTQYFRQLNQETREHSKRVAYLCSECAHYLRLEPDVAYRIGMYHDVGKIYIPSRILKKNGGLTQIEREVVDLHAYFGYRLLKEAGEESVVYLPTLFHHGYEKYKLCDTTEKVTKEISAYINLIHTVDIYEAMSSKRTYHVPFSQERIFSELESDPLCDDKIMEVLKTVALIENAKKEVLVNAWSANSGEAEPA